MKRIFSVTVENRSGVLSKVSGLFARRCFNIDSLAVGETDDHDISSMTIVSSGSAEVMEQVEKQLNKKLDVIKIKSFDPAEALSREMVLIKVRYNKSNRQDILEICAMTGAQIIDTSKTMMTLQLCSTPDMVENLFDLLASISIVDVARTGTVALTKCRENYT